MKKKLAIISYSIPSVNTYHEQIKSLFLEHIIVEKYCIEDTGLENGIKADLVLVPSYDIFRKIEKYIEKESEVLVANRTISKAALEKIMALPKGTEAVLLDESSEMAMEMTFVIYQLGARHIKLTPIYPECREKIDKEALILLGESKYIPSSAKEIINIGNSLLELSTIIDIGVKLDLVYLLQKQNIRKSYKEIVTTNFGLADIIGKTNRSESQLDILLQVLDDGIIGMNAEGIISSYNEGAENIIGYKKEEMIGRYGLDILYNIPFEYVLKNIRPVKEKLIKVNGYDVVVSVHPIIHSNRFYGSVAIIKKFSDAEKKQHKLRAQLIGKGHRAKYRFEDILGESDVIKKCKDIGKRMANSDSSILISGESGTGKELFAQAIHNSSRRKDYQFVAVNCGALPESLLESELFGYEEGAFTGARKGGKLGLFELAHNGTLFLDEIGEMPLNLQMRLLRVLQEREVMRIGGDRLIKVDIRIIAATNRDLKEMVIKGGFREDLYYRLNVLPLKIPPLRARKEDIFILIEEMRKGFKGDFHFTQKAKQTLLDHNWKGNVRELRNYIEYFANLMLEEIDVKDLPFDQDENLSQEILNEEEQILLEEFLEQAGKNIQKYIFVLETLENSYLNQIRLGRRSLYQIAKEKGIFIGEQEIRMILIYLEKFLMVEIFKGRSGSLITDYGRKVVKYLKTR